MNLNNVAKRDILDFDQFMKKVHDYNYKPLAPENQKPDDGASGLSPIKREPAFDFVGYADAVFAKQSKIGYPGLSFRDPKDGKIAPFIQAGSMDVLGQGGGAQEVGGEVSESLTSEFKITRISEF